MSSKPKYSSDAYESIHASAKALLSVGAIDKTTMRDFDKSCLVQVFLPAQIKKLRMQNKVSQSVFARYLNTSESTVRRWEAGAQRPKGMALTLLRIVQKHGLNVLA